MSGYNPSRQLSGHLAAVAMRLISASVSASSWKMPRGRLPRVAHGPGRGAALLSWPEGRTGSAVPSASSWRMSPGRLPRVAHGPGRGAALLSWPEGRTGSAVPSPVKDVELAAIGWGSRSSITGDNEAHAFSVAAIDERGTRSIALGTSRRLACGDEEHASPAAAIDERGTRSMALGTSRRRACGDEEHASPAAAIDERGSSLNGCEQKFAAAVLLACSLACLLVLRV